MLTESELSKRNARPTMLVGKAYLTAILFVALFVALLSNGWQLSSSLSEPMWAVLVAAVLTLPVLVPWLASTVLPRIRSIKISEMEIALQEIQAPSQAVTLAAQALGSN